MGSYSISVYATSPVSIRELVFTLNAYDFGPKLMAFPKSDTQYEEMREGGRKRKENNCNESHGANAAKLNMCI